jgi:hypothetical protein
MRATVRRLHSRSSGADTVGRAIPEAEMLPFILLGFLMTVVLILHACGWAAQAARTDRRHRDH